MCGFCNVLVCECVGFVMCVCVCMGFVMFGCVYGWVLQYVGVLTIVWVFW